MRFVLLLVALLAPAVARADHSFLDRSLSRPDARRLLHEVKHQVKALARQGRRPLVVCDLDDTLIRRRTSIPGAVSYLNKLTRDGARIIYLTGRPTYKKHDTIALLKHLGLPVHGQKFLFNPLSHDAAEWKRSARPMILERGTPVAFFENDKRAACTYSQQYRESRVIRLNTRSSRSPLAQWGANLAVIQDFTPY